MNGERLEPEIQAIAGSSPATAAASLPAVHSDAGHKLSRVTLGLWPALARLVAYLVLPGLFFFGFLWILGDDKRQAWHDKVARTYVVYAWDARPDETFLADNMKQGAQAGSAH